MLSVFGLSLVCALHFGASSFGIAELFESAIGPTKDPMAQTIMSQVRLPRVLAAMLCGMLLAGAGVLTQGYFRNSLASPTVLGTTSGATSFVALSYFLGIGLDDIFVVPMFSVLGASVSTGLILALAYKKTGMHHPERILIIGFALSTLFGALAMLFVSLVLKDHQKAQGMFYWLMGGFHSKGWSHVSMLLPFFVVGCLIARRCLYKLNVLTLGDEVAATLGVHLVGLRLQVIMAVAIMVGGAIAIGGGIGFVGFVIPHLTRQILGFESKRLFWYSMINGASTLVVADLVARTAIAPAELQVGVMTALFAAPFFIILVLRTSSSQVP